MRLGQISPPRGTACDRVNVYSRDTTVFAKAVAGSAATLVQSDVRCHLGTNSTAEIAALLGQVTAREEIAVFGRLPIIKDKYELRLSSDETKRWIVKRVESYPSARRVSVQVAYLAVDSRTGEE